MDQLAELDRLLLTQQENDELVLARLNAIALTQREATRLLDATIAALTPKLQPGEPDPRD